MLPLLTRFYYECMLPEILDSCHNRHMPIRNPNYITEAIQAKNACTKRNSPSRDISTDESAEQQSPITAVAVSTLERQDNDCIIISHSKHNFTDEDVKKFKTTLDDTIIALSLLEQNILPMHSKLNDESLNAFLRVVRETSPFETQSVQYLEFPKLIDASNSDKSIQIIGGNCTDHWRCIFFDGSKLHVYDSIPRCTYKKLAEQEKHYIRLRFPQVSVGDIIFEKVQTQPDSTCCGFWRNILQYKNSVIETCRYLWNSHMSIVHSMLSSQSNVKQRKVVLKLLAAIVSLDGNLEKINREETKKDYVIKRLCLAAKGSTDKECAKRVMEKLMSNHVGTFYSWQEVLEKNSFKNTIMMETVRLAIKKLRHDVNMVTTEDSIKDWLKSRKFVKNNAVANIE
ncbi:hypothetical protein DMN91_004051 [Ooceraea biroi]|uniref:Uncharacterized protein n=1 Tax=Ooceraea biroi TaxID=2015173 RepID=A0A3L8DUJ3_OOCBI|nr:hypothetical protein DMN91_004051 [Ooceraea biroi]